MGLPSTPASRRISRGGCECATRFEAKGTVVLDENFRTGRRARKMHGEGDRKKKLRKREGRSKHFLELPIYPALKGANEILMGLEGGVETAVSSKQAL